MQVCCTICKQCYEELTCSPICPHVDLNGYGCRSNRRGFLAGLVGLVCASLVKYLPVKTEYVIGYTELPIDCSKSSLLDKSEWVKLDASVVKAYRQRLSTWHNVAAREEL